METFAPQPLTNEETTFENPKNTKPDTLTLNKKQDQQKTKYAGSQTTINKFENTTNTIETDLYIAEVSSVNGGSIQGFLLKDFLAPDSQKVNTISQNKKNNLEIEIQDLNGDPIPLNGNWKYLFKNHK